MKIGILTFHSQLNYGGVLQCWALQTALEEMGYEVVVIDRWFDKDNSSLEGCYAKWGVIEWVNFWIRSMLGLGNLNGWLRVKRTKSFISKKLKLTPYHFVEWKDAPKELSVDYVIVGSDQVWHCGDWGDPRVYLLDDAPNLKYVAYAASFGLLSLPKIIYDFENGKMPIMTKDLYKCGLAKFKAISCREAEGVEICRSLGFYAKHLVDPTLLGLRTRGSYCNNQHDLVCYFLSERLEENFDALEQFAHNHHCRVKVFIDWNWLLPMPTNCKKIKHWFHGILKKCFSPINVMDGAGPEEFYIAFQNAKWVISDSFHALMFSLINNCNVRIIRPSSDMRRLMFARIEEFAKHINGPLVVNTISEAIDSLNKGESIEYDDEWILQRKEESIEWLKDNLS